MVPDRRRIERDPEARGQRVHRPGRKLVLAEPTFEAIRRPLRARSAPRSTASGSTTGTRTTWREWPPAAPGLIYVCNPNNPTGSITPKARVRSFLDAVPEATHRPRRRGVSPLRGQPGLRERRRAGRDRPNLIVARTFSKIHGLAGLRLGYAIAQPPVIEKLAEHAAWDSANIVGLAAARASLADAAYVAEGRRRNAATKAHVVAELGKLGYQVVPSQTNFILVDSARR